MSAPVEYRIDLTDRNAHLYRVELTLSLMADKLIVTASVSKIPSPY